MYQAEHLELFTSVNDQFTDDLTRLSGLLETVGQQADALDPIRLRVVVHDGQLRNLQRKIAQTSVADAVSDTGSRSGLPMLDPSELSNTTGRSPTEIFQESVRDFSSTVSDIKGGVPSGVGQNAALGAGAVGIMGVINSLMNQGDGDGSGRTIAPDDIDAFEDALGLSFDGAFERSSVNVRGLMTDTEAPFQLPEDELEDMFSSRAFISAFDFEGLNAALGDEMSVSGPRDLVNIDGSDIAEAADFDSFGDTVDEFTDTEGFRRRQLLNTFVDLRVGMTQFYDILAAGLPLLATFIGSIPATIGALGGLAAAAVGAAGALGGIAGLGFLGAAAAQAGGEMPGFEDFQAVLDDLPDEFYEAFRPLAEDLRPTFEAGLSGLEQLFDEMADSASVLTQLEDDARAFGGFVMDFVPNTVEELLLLAEASSGIFGDVGAALRRRDIIAGFAGAAADALPYLTTIAVTIADALPAIQQFSLAMLANAEALVSLGSTALYGATQLSSLFGVLGSGANILGRGVSGVLMFTSAVLLMSKAVALTRSGLYTFTTALIGQRAAAIASSRAMLIYRTAARALTFDSVIATAAVRGLTGAILGLLAVTGIGIAITAIGGAASWAANRFDLLGRNVRDSTKALKEFERQRTSMGSRSQGFVGELGRDVYIDVTDNRETTVEGSADPSTVEYESFVTSSRQPGTMS